MSDPDYYETGKGKAYGSKEAISEKYDVPESSLKKTTPPKPPAHGGGGSVSVVTLAPSPSASTLTVDPVFVGPPAPVPDPSPPQPGDPSFVGPVQKLPPQPGDPGFVGPVDFPLWYSTQVRTPESIRFLGLGYQYLRYGYTSLVMQDIIPESFKLLRLDPQYLRYGYGGMPKSFESLFESRFEQLTPARKFEYGLRFGDIKKVPIGEWK
ncbi:unnamed protein product, partial [marine sediment metagenome]